jgi:hypothetical protein
MHSKTEYGSVRVLVETFDHERAGVNITPPTIENEKRRDEVVANLSGGFAASGFAVYSFVVTFEQNVKRPASLPD